MVLEDCRSGYTYGRMCRISALSAVNTVTLGCLCYLAQLSNSFLTFLQSTGSCICELPSRELHSSLQGYFPEGLVVVTYSGFGGILLQSLLHRNLEMKITL